MTTTGKQIDLEEQADLVATAQSEMIGRLAGALAVGQDRALRERLAVLAGAKPGEPFQIAQLRRQAWIKVEDAGVSVHRERIFGLVSVDMDDVLRADAALSGEFDRSLFATSATSQAERLLRPVFEPSPLMSREEFQALRRWSPLLEHLSYRCAMLISDITDTLRPRIMRIINDGIPPNSTVLHVYWNSIHTAAHLILISSAREARPWLGGLANHFVWTTWTPTFGLTRERTFWLAAVAARSVIAFGETVVEGYFRTLSQSVYPMTTFDALFGLTAIALDNPSARNEILNEVLSLRADQIRRNRAYAEYFEKIYENAVSMMSRTLEDKWNVTEFSELHWRVGSAKGMGTRAALLGDPTDLLVSKKYGGFSMLPFVVATSIEDHYPKLASVPMREIPQAKIQDMFRRAWMSDDAVKQRLH